MEMAWGMIMTGFTLFGMMALVIMSITVDEHESASAHRHMDESAAPVTEIRKAA